MTDHLSALDATFLELEQADESAHMHIGGVMVFDPLPEGGSPTVERVREHLEDRLDLMPRYRQRLSAPRAGGLAWPTWQDDPGFEVSTHVGHAALPSPGGEEELCDWVSDFYSHRLDRNRALWEMVLLEGLSQERWALCWKTHHCLVDGVGSVDVVHLMLDAEREPNGNRAVPEAPAAAAAQRSIWPSLLPRVPEPVAQVTEVGVKTAAAAIHATLHPREAFKRARSVTELILREEVIAAPHTTLNVPISGTRSFMVVRIPLDAMKGVAHGLGGKVNDVALAAATAGLRRMLQEREEELPARGLRAMVPVNVRDAAEHMALGNKIASLFVDLPVAEERPRVRYEKIVKATSQLKAGGQALGAGTLIDLTALAPPIVHATLARSLYATRLFNVTITNVPGPQMSLYAFGARLREVQPLVPLAAGHAVGIAILSYDGNVVFGLNADRDSVPDLGVLADGIEDAIGELCTLSLALKP
jgi:diacylglycerol O-acyltransferase / wax synthase